MGEEVSRHGQGIIGPESKGAREVYTVLGWLGVVFSLQGIALTLCL